MSRIGKMPVPLPPKVKVEINGQQVSVEGPKGKLQFELPLRTSAKLDGASVLVSRAGDDAQAKSLHGLSRALLHNMVKGVSEGFVKKLEIQGVGFKAAVQGDKVNLALGYSHPINYLIPPQIKVTVEENTKLTIEGPDKQVVGQVAAELRSFYPPEPYKGKGVRYVGEKVVRKEGKTVQ
ncbi:MAG TPA: 50S ribosomal protein L6 [Candidatus Acidoferrum sp.]|nr:50S ribosomal protein L6 [Candidatus Acidoferrum sp.]